MPGRLAGDAGSGRRGRLAVSKTCWRGAAEATTYALVGNAWSSFCELRLSGRASRDQAGLRAWSFVSPVLPQYNGR